MTQNFQTVKSVCRYRQNTEVEYIGITYPFHATLGPANGLRAVTQQLTTSEGLALKLCNVSDCFPTIIPPSSLTQLPVTSTDKGHTLEGYFLCRATHTFIHMHLHHTCTSTHTGRGRILRNDTIVLVVARSRCNLWWDRVAGLAPHHCLPTR